MKYGLEVELHSDDSSSYVIRDMNGLSYTSWSNDILGDIGVKMSEEYYERTIAYNFTPIGYNNTLINNIVNFLSEQRERFSLDLNSSQPSFVGTHVHLFGTDEELNAINKNKLLKHILYYIVENISDLESNSINRLLISHQLWGNWSHTNSHKWRNLLNDFGIAISYYEGAGSRRKYRPIITSASREDGKPKSVEFRVVPNEFVFNGKLEKLLSYIDDGSIYEMGEMTVIDFHKALLKHKGYDVDRNDIRRERRSANEYTPTYYFENDYNNNIVRQGLETGQTMELTNQYIDLYSLDNEVNTQVDYISDDGLYQLRNIGGEYFFNLTNPTRGTAVDTPLQNGDWVSYDELTDDEKSWDGLRNAIDYWKDNGIDITANL